MKRRRGRLAFAVALCLATPVHAQIPIELVRSEEVYKGVLVMENVLKEVYKRAGFDLTVIPMPSARAEYEASHGEKDGELGRLWRYGDTHPTLIRVEPSFANASIAMFARSASNVVIKDPGDLKKYTVGFVRTSQWAKDVTKDFPKDQVELANHARNLMSMLEAGRFDVAIESKLQAQTIIKRQGLKGIVQVGPEAVVPVYCYLHEKNKQYVPLIAASIKKLKDSGELDKLVKAEEERFLSRQ